MSIAVLGVLGQTSTASITFNGVSGTYDILTRYVGQVQNGVSSTTSTRNMSPASNAVTVTTPVTPQVYLRDLTWVSATAGFGTVQKDKSVDGKTLKLNGTTYSKGLGTHATSNITYNLNGQYTWFQSFIGVDDEVSSNATVVFQVWADGNKIYDSQTMTPTSATKSVDVSVAGVNQLVLTVTDAGDGINNDHADWANAKLSR